MKVSSKTNLADYVANHYIGSVSVDREPGINRAVSLFAWSLRRQPILSDLSLENLDALRETIAIVEPSMSTQAVDGLITRLILVWRHAMLACVLPIDDDERIWKWGKKSRAADDATRPLVRRKQRPPLDDNEGTLWHYCLTIYFPKNIAIQNKATKQHYHVALGDLRDAIGHEPTFADLTDDNLVMMMKSLQARGLAPTTINERWGRVAALWTWCAKRRIVEMFPTASGVKEPNRIPVAWSQKEVQKIFEACQDVGGGKICGIRPRYWWGGLHHVLWDTGARIGEVLALRWAWLNPTTGSLLVPAEVRKGQERDMSYRLSPECLTALELMREPKRDLIFPYPHQQKYLWTEYKKILKRAGLPHDRKCMFHRMRRSVASHVQAAGHDASVMLAHSSADLTRKSYLDPSIVATLRPSDVLFKPAVAVEVPLPSRKNSFDRPVASNCGGTGGVG